MSRADYRSGRAQLRTAAELSEILPGVIYLLATGRCAAFFPNKNRAHPVPGVVVKSIQTIPLRLRYMEDALPLWFHWTQWRDVVVPVMNDARVVAWLGKPTQRGRPLTLPVDVYGPGGTLIYAKGTSSGTGVVTHQPTGAGIYVGHTDEYLGDMGKIVLGVATTAGY